MFTGLVESTGTILSVIPSAGATRITVVAGALASRLKLGDSVAVNGTCLTALAIESSGATPHFSADLAAETIARTTLSTLRPGTVVNLELPTPAGSPLGGHVVQGHVDGTATLVSLTPIHPEHPETSDWRLRLNLPEHLVRFVVAQGSITVEGISLTVASISGTAVEIAVIPHTYAATNLRTLRLGDPLNIETDVLARYAEQQRTEPQRAEPQKAEHPAGPGFHLDVAYLLANGY